MIDFLKLSELQIPEGNVERIERNGVLLWDKLHVSLEVEKKTMTTYSDGVTYPSERVIVLRIYPSAAGQVWVSYGGLTKIVTFTNTVSKLVHFGTLNGVPDEVETPSSGTLKICGAVRGVSIPRIKADAYGREAYCFCITGINSWGRIQYIPSYGFYNCDKLEITSIPEGITSIGQEAFAACDNIVTLRIPSTVTEIGYMAFSLDLVRLDIDATTPPELSSYGKLFGSHVPPAIVVPDGCGDVYKAATGWSEYADHIKEASEMESIT